MRLAVLAVAAPLLALAACSEGQAQPGPEISRSFAVGPFSAIEVRGAYDVEVTTGRPVAVSARGTQRLVEGIVAEVKDGRLIIRPDETRRWRESWGHGRSWAKVSVSVPALSAASVAGSGGMTIDRVTGDRFSGAVAGSGDLVVKQVAVGGLKLSGAGSGEIRVAGQARSADYSIAGSGDVDAAGLTAEQAAVSVAGSGSVRARVTGTASANVAGSGDIDISGGARCQQSRMGSGSIRCS